MEIEIETIRKAVTRHHGGLQKATDAEIRIIWGALPPDVQEKYLTKIKVRRDKDAPRNPSKRDL